MKHFALFVVCFGICLLSPLCITSYAEEKSDDNYMEILDIVSEWSPEADSIQIGDINISSFRTVWIEDGSKILRAGKKDIKAGGVVKAYLTVKDKNGFWLADRIVILTGDALQVAIKSFSKKKQLTLLRAQEYARTQVIEKNVLPNETQPILDSGVWKN